MTRAIALLLGLLALGACNRVDIDPYTRPGVWRPNGANDDNLRAMVAVPADLATAAAAGPADGGLAAAALNRLRHDQAHPLPDTGVLQVVPVSNGAVTQPPATPGPGSGN